MDGTGTSTDARTEKQLPTPVPDNPAPPADRPMKEAPSNGKRGKLWEFFGHNLVARLVALGLAAVGVWVGWQRHDRAEERKTRIALAREMESWVAKYVATVRDSANLAPTYGNLDSVDSGLRALHELRNSSGELFNSRGVELASLFGSAARDSLSGMDDATRGLQHCYEVIRWRMTEQPTEPAVAPQRQQLRNNCSIALRDLDLARTKLLTVITSRIAADAGEKAQEPPPVEWVRTVLEANGRRREVKLVGTEPFNFSWSSPDAIMCVFESPTGPSGVSRIGMGGPIDTNHPWYPRVGSTTVLKFYCTNMWTNGADEVRVTR